MVVASHDVHGPVTLERKTIGLLSIHGGGGGVAQGLFRMGNFVCQAVSPTL